MSTPTDDFAQMWEWFATHCHGYSPLYERISIAVAGDRELLAQLRTAPPSAHLPPALLAAVHYLLLEGSDPVLSPIYAGRSEADPGPPFLDFCRSRRHDVMAILARRRIQTNECGRSAVIGPGLTWLSSQLEGPLSLIDVGASAGLNLLCDRFRIDYGGHGATGHADSPVRISCDVVAGQPPIAERLPPLESRVGIDHSPIDLSDPDDARWLLACVWPDTGRLERTRASIRLAQSDPPRVIGGDAVETLPGVLAALPARTVPVVITTWAFAYLSLDQRWAFTELLEAESQRRPLAWLSAEGAGTVEAFAGRGMSADAEAEAENVLGAVVYAGGEPRADMLALVQEHGSWIDWRASS